ncbi:hypothetical protein VYU27_007051 [Nannochloropsis oceanica]
MEVDNVDTIIASPDKKRTKLDTMDNDSDDDDFFDRMVGAATSADAEETLVMGSEEQSPPHHENDGREQDEDAEWCRAMQEHAMATSVVKDEADPIWFEHILRGVLGHSGGTDIAAYALDTDVKIIILTRFLGARRGGGEASLLSKSLLWDAVEQATLTTASSKLNSSSYSSSSNSSSSGSSSTFFLDNLFTPQVALAVRQDSSAGLPPSTFQVLFHALNTSAVLAVLACLGFGVPASPISAWHLQHVDPLHESGLLSHIAESPILTLTHRESEYLYALPPSLPSSSFCLASPLPPFPPAPFLIRAFPPQLYEHKGTLKDGYELTCNDISLCAVYRREEEGGAWRLQTTATFRGRGYEGELLKYVLNDRRAKGGREKEEVMKVWVRYDDDGEEGKEVGAVGGLVGEKGILEGMGSRCLGVGVDLWVAHQSQ